MIFKEEVGDQETEPSYLCDAELEDETIRKALSSPLFIQERGESADRRQAYHSYEESLLPAQSFFAHSRTVRPMHELSSLSSCTEKPSVKWKTKESGFSLKDKKSKFSLKSERRSISTNFKPILIGEVFFFITLSRRIQFVDFQRVGTHITACNERTPNTRHNFGSEMPVRTVSQKFIQPQSGEIFKELWSRPTTTVDFACWKIRFKIEVCTCSQFPTEAMLWIKEVVESVDDLKSSRSIRGTQTAGF